MQLRSSVALAVIVVLAHPVGLAASPEKESGDRAPWQWSNEERAASRVDPVKVRERARAAGEEPQSAQNSQATTNNNPNYNPNRFVVYGSRNPELLMPFEVFVVLLMELSLQDRNESAVGLNPYSKGIRQFGWQEEEFWRQLREITEPTRGIQKRKNSLERQVRTSDSITRRRLFEEIDTLRNEGCRTRTAALRTARSVFGEREFNRFLYTVVAPGIQMPSESTEAERERLISVEGGCQ